MDYPVLNKAPNTAEAVVPHVVNADGTVSPIGAADAGGVGLPVTPSGSAPVGGGITWGAPTAVAVTAGPASTVLIAANAARKALQIWNPIGNAQMSVNIAGGAAVLATSRPLLAGFSLDYDGAACPVTAVTFIGTAGQSLVYQEGT